jgi:TonB family protein
MAEVETAMRRIVVALSLLVVSASIVSAQEPSENPSAAPFQGSVVSEAGELANIKFIGGIGIAVLEPVIGEEGNVESVNVVRSTPGLETWAVGAVKAWKFRPAVIDGKPARSKTTVVIVFNQGFNVPPAFSLPPLAEHNDKNGREENGRDAKVADFSPAAPTDVVIPEYPVMSVLTTTVVLRVELESTGDIDTVKPLHDVAAYSPRAIDAVKKWQFSPAKFQGQPVRSNLTVAVLFVPPPVSD